MIITKEQLLQASESEYMNDDQLDFFKVLLEDLKFQTLEDIEASKNELSHPPEMNDEGDRAAYEEESSIRLRTLDRDRKLIPKIDAALKRINDKTYGYCLESGEPIGIPRLLTRPTAELCIEIKTLAEMKDRNYSR
ncbi:RNA polymerase-binding protein DksA [Nitrincola tibetensis]|uniref:RNA polymerase-binding protein DksA n=1 Tax=Nitrincola tibetensis TaxID=2219697 RepID=A0A364NJB0_9GAMM|nr:RNA polymerase-binding protein DksA [Nitrincola tibetensis]RAU17219.1 RNA polymerase-binding protein DksA [Nitrincola tibetensis]